MSSPCSILITYRPETGDAPVHVTAPPSKSIFNRVAIINALQGVKPHVVTDGLPADVRVMCRALCGDDSVSVDAGDAVVVDAGDAVVVDAGDAVVVDAGDAGTAARFLVAYYAVTQGARVVVKGSGRLSLRPLKPLLDALGSLGASIKGDSLPVEIEGCKLKGGRVELDGSVSSQFATALMLVAPYMAGGLSLKINKPVVSRPYIDMTARLMDAVLPCGAVTLADTADALLVSVAPGGYCRAIDIDKVAGDWSAAAFFHEVTAITGRTVVIDNVSRDGLQGDEVAADIFAEPFSTHLSMVECPDLVPAYVATLCYRGLPFCIKGLSTLPAKECDRLQVLASELAKLGYGLETDGAEYLAWDGVKSLCEKSNANIPVIDPHGDHRIAMALAPMAAEGDIVMLTPGVVDKSFPGYWDNLARVGYIIKEL